MIDDQNAKNDADRQNRQKQTFHLDLPLSRLGYNRSCAAKFAGPVALLRFGAKAVNGSCLQLEKMGPRRIDWFRRALTRLELSDGSGRRG